jgi:hypothetical protein
MLGFDKAAGGDDVFRQLALARIVEPTSKADSLRVLAEAGMASASYPALNRRLPVFAKASFRQALSTGVRRSCSTLSGFVGALRRHRAVLRNRHWRWSS